MTQQSNTTPKKDRRPTTPIGEALEQLSDHRFRADEESRLVFCPSLETGKAVRIHAVH